VRIAVLALLAATIGCSSPSPAPKPTPAAPSGAPGPAAPAPESATTGTQRFEADTPGATAAGHRFLVPAGWSLRVAGRASILEAPEGGSSVAFVDVDATDADGAVAEAWAAYRPGGAGRPLRSSTPSPNKDGWRDRRSYAYQTSPNEARAVGALAMQRGGRWAVRIADLANAVAGKREADIALLFDQFLPQGFVRESFAGRQAHALDAARVAEIKAFVERARQTLEVPGVSVGVVQGDKIVFAGGFGVRELGKPGAVDADTAYLIASNTKSLTTLMLAKLVDEQKMAWDAKVSSLLPEFRLGDDETTEKVLVKHLLCACTGLPRHDLEWLLGPENATPSLALTILGRMRPTSEFGKNYQYSNPIAAAAGLVGGRVAFPGLGLGEGYDRAMSTRVFGPLGMARTTFDFARATRGNYARPYAYDLDGKVAPVDMALNVPIRAVRPAGGAWSTVNDLLKYVKMELAKGALPGGGRYISENTLAARQAPQVKTGKDSWYGMGLDVDMSTGTRLVYHGGRMRGYRTNMAWLPEHGVGVVVLTNADSGNVLMDAVPRKVLEVLFDGASEAEASVEFAAKAAIESRAAWRRNLRAPADPAEVAKLAPRYRNDVLGELKLVTSGSAPAFDFRTWKAPLASRKNPDGTITFVVAALGWWPEFVAGERDGRRTLVIRDQQHEYIFTESD
jgi:CubicO group peptidase (beta-lactamase class C family)